MTLHNLYRKDKIIYSNCNKFNMVATVLYYFRGAFIAEVYWLNSTRFYICKHQFHVELSIVSHTSSESILLWNEFSDLQKKLLKVVDPMTYIIWKYEVYISFNYLLYIQMIHLLAYVFITLDPYLPGLPFSLRNNWSMINSFFKIFIHQG